MKIPMHLPAAFFPIIAAVVVLVFLKHAGVSSPRVTGVAVAGALVLAIINTILIVLHLSKK